jgi:hypothetical protein
LPGIGQELSLKREFHTHILLGKFSPTKTTTEAIPLSPEGDSPLASLLWNPGRNPWATGNSRQEAQAS